MPQLSALTMAALSVTALAAIGGGVSYAAKDAVPGDFLYPVHTTIYGDASTAADAQVQLNAAQELHDAAVNLAVQGKLTTDVRADMKEQFDAHIRAVQQIMGSLEADGHADDAARVHALLDVTLKSMGDVFTAHEATSDASAESSVWAEAESSVSVEDNTMNVETNDESAGEMNVSNDLRVNVDANADATASIR